MIPLLEPNDMKMFYNYLDNATVYFEYGSGGSTYQASIRKNIQHIYSVESDIQWQNKLKQTVSNSNITYIFNDMQCLPNNWGNPGENAEDSQKKNYSSHITKLSPKNQSEIDLVLIDGRFRVACCLKCLNVVNDNCLIAFDDFLNRKHYHIVLDYFDIIDKTIDNKMVILKRKNEYDICELQRLINKYELIHS